MASKKIRVNYYYPTISLREPFKKERLVIYKLDRILNILSDLNLSDRVYTIEGEDENIQLKRINKVGEDRWELGFLKNTKETFFKGTLNDEIEEAEPLEEDEFIGYECCVIYDNKSNVLALQNNAKSISYRNLSRFFNEFINIKLNEHEKIQLLPITLKPEYSNISDDININYKNVIINYLDISAIEKMAKLDNVESVEMLAKLSNNLGALKGRLELGVGRTKNLFLGKDKLKEIVTFFKRHPNLTNGMKVKMYDEDTIRIIDLIENKLKDEFTISITRDDVKTFEKIFFPMHSYLDSKIEEDLQNCVKITE